MLAAVANETALENAAQAGWRFRAELTEEKRQEMRRYEYSRSLKYFSNVDQVIKDSHDRIVPLSLPRLRGGLHTFPIAIDGFTESWLVNLHNDPETSGVYLILVLDRHRPMRSTCVDAHTSAPLI